MDPEINWDVLKDVKRVTKKYRPYDDFPPKNTDEKKHEIASSVFKSLEQEILKQIGNHLEKNQEGKNEEILKRFKEVQESMKDVMSSLNTTVAFMANALSKLKSSEELLGFPTEKTVKLYYKKLENNSDSRKEYMRFILNEIKTVTSPVEFERAKHIKSYHSLRLYQVLLSQGKSICVNLPELKRILTIEKHAYSSIGNIKQLLKKAKIDIENCTAHNLKYYIDVEESDEGNTEKIVIGLEHFAS